MNSPTDLAIRLEGLTKRFGTKEVLSDFDLEVPAGQILGLLGPNGAGKSTTIKMLMGLLPPTGGRAEVLGFDPQTEPIEVRRRVGYVPESGAVFEALTGWEYLMMVGALFHLDEVETGARIERFARFLDLPDDALHDQRLATYSKGMRQKVVITSGLLHHPRVVLFDEPLNGLDANAAVGMKGLITSLARDGRTIVYCSHVLDVVERLCERVVIIHQGRKIADGTPQALCARSGQPTLEAFFNQVTGTTDLLARAADVARALAE